MLEASHLSVSYGAHRALEDVSVHVGKGEICVILGANGAGKSTLLKAIAGVQHAAPGAKIVVDDQDITGQSASRIVEHGIALVPEGRGIFADLTVAENLALGAYGQQARADRDERMKQVLDLFPKLGERQHQIARTMSGGEQQMVAIGRALMSNPDILMLDEPSLGLSPILSSELFKTLKQIGDIGVGILLVEQNAKRSLAIADRVYLLENGHITGEGRAAAMANDPAVQNAYLGGAADKTTHRRLGERDMPTGIPVAARRIGARTETATDLATRASQIQRAHIDALRHGSGSGLNGRATDHMVETNKSQEPIVMPNQAHELSAEADDMARRAAAVSAAHVIAQRQAALSEMHAATRDDSKGKPKKDKKTKKAKKARKKSK